MLSSQLHVALFCLFTLFMAIMKKMDEWKVQGKRAPILSAFERGPTKMLSPVYVEGWIDATAFTLLTGEGHD